ncbi:restriction endonuclease subunit S [Bifidobacterium sp. SO1]|uniref:restriction endonuclease subunit S n=1 Tax=Bifidobacterium sp. SO1 TaxID=2809029 RepID=UPI001BDCBAF4|nr:restriction endonuclease subunit S [Bifidobacterium sp. SO1]MBT1162890.1 restriction endonuclease subunit S [Bifidobacterium sp. SO1]
MRTREEIHNVDWFGVIPDGWEMKPLKALFTFSKGMTVTKADLTDEGARVINYGQVHSKTNTGVTIKPELIRNIAVDKVPTNAKTAKSGSFIFACTSEDLQGCGDCIYLDTETGAYAGGDTILLSPNDGCPDNKFLAYQFLTDEWRYQLRRDLVDVKVFHVNGGNLKETYVILPPVEVRRAIVSYLDAHCTPIDEAIARHREAIGKLEEYRRAVITKTVTKGLDPNAPMKDSRIGWIGMMPATWEAKRIKFVAKLASGGTPSRDHAEYWDGDIPWVKTGELNGGYVLDTEERITDLGLANSSAKLFPKGTLLMAMYGQGKTRGTTGCLGVDAAINQACVAFTSLNGILKDYLWMALRAIYVPIREAAVGSGQPNLSSALINNFSIPVPSYDEQVEIATYLDCQCAAVDDAIDRQNQIIGKLEEYRRSLIHAAVTGRIDCTKGAMA